jgi:hypothetical protein
MVGPEGRAAAPEPTPLDRFDPFVDLTLDEVIFIDQSAWMRASVITCASLLSYRRGKNQENGVRKESAGE